MAKQHLLRQSEAREAAILKSAPDAIIIMDREGKFVEFNPAAEKIFGYSRAEVLGKPLGDFIIPVRLRERHNQGLAYYLATGTGPVLNRHVELPALRADGTEFPVELAIIPIADSDPLLFAGFMRDISERKQAEKTLRDSEERYRTLLDSIDEGFCVVEMIFDERDKPVDYRFLQLSPSFEKQSGLKDALGKTIRELAPLHEDHWFEIFGKIAVTGEAARFQNRADQLRRWFDVYAFRFGAAENRHVAILFNDITPHKQAEASLRESEDRFRAIAENIPQLAWMADGECRVDWFNRGWLDYTGTTLEENTGAGWKAVHHPDHVDAVAEKFERHLREGRDWEDTFPLRGKDGNYRWFLSRMNVIRDESGKVVRFFGTNTDVTNERKAEERLQLLMNELAHRGKNLLAVIQSIASRSLSGTRPLAEARDVLTQRIQALARSQSVLMTEGFEGASVAEIVRLEFEAFSERVKAVGHDVILNPRAAQTFALVVHELATNAAKHGALSVPGGQVVIRWSIEGAGANKKFKFQWQELDGPPVVPPTRQGFGRILLEKAVAQDFETQPKIRFAPEGLRYEIDAPLSVVAADSAVGGGDDGS